jgi:hypothetical protein
MNETDIANLALSKLGGSGSSTDGSGLITSIDSTTDPTAVKCHALFDTCRQKVIIDLANAKCPFRETLKYADLGADLKASDWSITSIAIGATPTFYVTVTTSEAHGYTTGDTIMLFDIQGTGVTALNGTLKTITVTTTTAFTLDSTTGKATWEHTAETGFVSTAPESGGFTYAFDLPSACLAVVRLIDEDFSDITARKLEYPFEVVLDKDSNSKVLLANDYTNSNGDGAFIEYVIDQTTVSLFSQSLIECLATLLAAEMAAFVVTNDGQKRRYFLFTEYATLVEQAKIYNQSQAKNKKRNVPDYLGNRGGSLDIV